MRSRGLSIWSAAAMVALMLCALLGCRQHAAPTASNALRETIVAIGQGKLQRASAIAESAIRDYPDSHYSWWALGSVRLHQREYVSAEQAFRKAISLEPDEPDLHYGLARTLAWQGDFAEATAEYSVVLESEYPRKADAQADLAWALIQQSEWDEAMKQAQQALELEPSTGAAYLVLGYVWAVRGQLDESIDALSEAVSLLPTSALARSHLAEALRRCGRTEEALQEAHRAVELDGLSQPHTTIGLILYRDQRYADALEHFRTAAAIDPERPEHHYNIGRSLMKLHRTDEARAAYRRAFEMSPETPRFAAAYTDLLRGMDELDDAIAAQRQAVSSAPGNPEQSLMLAQMLWYSDRIAEAALEYQRAVGRGRHDPETVIAASNLLLQTGNNAAAVEMLRSVYRDRDEDPWVPAELARTLIFTGSIGEARALLSRASSSGGTDGASAHAARSRAVAWMYLDEWDAATSEAEIARKAYPNLPWPREYEAVMLALSGKYREADELLRREDATEGSPMATAAYAYVRVALGYPDEARSILSAKKTALTWEYAPLEVQYLTALTYQKLGERERSRTLFRRAIDRWPKHPWSERMRKKMQEGTQE